MAPEIQVRIKCFSHIKQALGRGEFVLSMPIHSTTEDVEKNIREQVPGQLNDLPIRVAVNHVYARNPVTLKDGDEVALIPPVQGG